MKKIILNKIYKIHLDNGDKTPYQVEFSEKGNVRIHNSPLTSYRDFFIYGDAHYPVKEGERPLWKIKLLSFDPTKKGGINGLWVSRPTFRNIEDDIYTLYVINGESRRTGMTSRVWQLDELDDGELIHHYQVKNWEGYWIVAVKQGKKATIRFSYGRHTGRGNNYHDEATIELIGE